MTTAERLVRNLCDAARKRVERDANEAIETVKAETPVEKVSPKVRKAINTLLLHNKAVSEARETIREAGFDVPDLDKGKPSHLAPAYKTRIATEQAIDSKRHKRLQQIEEIRTSMAVKIYGKDTAKAGELLRALEVALAKI